jgi:hypothetical protein
MIRRFLLGTAALALAACAPDTAQRLIATDLAAELVPATDDIPPETPEGACWARALTPAVIETEIRQVMTPPTAGGAASFRTDTRQKIVQDRRDVWFRTPCDAEMTVTLLASLQRALKARGYYRAPVTGRMDAATADAIRRFQQPRGLDSATLSLGAARALGLIAADLAALQ